MEIEIPRRVGLAALLSGALLLLAVLGYVASPRTGDGRPVLLLPDVRAIELYRRATATWTADWRDIGETLAGLLDRQEAPLLDQSRTAQEAFAESVAVARRLESTEAPVALLGLHDQAMAVAAAHVDASTAVNRWLSGPSAENLSAAHEAVEQARTLLAALQANQWLAEPAAAQAQPGEQP